MSNNSKSLVLLALLCGVSGLAMELLQLGLKSLLSLSGRNNNLLNKSISDESVLWFVSHLVVLGVIKVAHSCSSASSESGFDEEQGDLLNWDTPLLRDFGLDILNWQRGSIWMEYVENLKLTRLSKGIWMK